MTALTGVIVLLLSACGQRGDAGSVSSTLESPQPVPAVRGIADITAAHVGSDDLLIFGRDTGEVSTAKLRSTGSPVFLADLGTRVVDVALSNDGRGFAAVSVDQVLYGQFDKLQFQGKSFDLEAVAFDSPGSNVAVAGMIVQVRKVSSGQPDQTYDIPMLEGGRGAYRDVALDGDRLVAVTVEGADVWERGRSEPLGRTLTCACEISSVSVSADTSVVAFGSEDGHVIAYATSTGEVLLDDRVGSGAQRVTAVAVSADGSVVAGFTLNGDAAVWKSYQPAWRGSVAPVQVGLAQIIGQDRVLLLDGSGTNSDALFLASLS